jgi:hypothetical protein
MMLAMLDVLCFYVGTFRSIHAVPKRAVFCSPLTSCYLGMLLRYFLNDLEVVDPVIIDIAFVSYIVVTVFIVWGTYHVYIRNFLASFLIIFISPAIATSINIHVPFALSHIMMSGLWLWMSVSFCSCWFDLPQWLDSDTFGACSQQCIIIIIIIIISKLRELSLLSRNNYSV